MKTYSRCQSDTLRGLFIVKNADIWQKVRKILKNRPEKQYNITSSGGEKGETSMAYRAIDVAKYIVNKCTVENAPVSNLQLQKILYYVQKSFLEYDMVAFDDDFEAWQFGPVVPEVYYAYCGFGSLSICLEYKVSVQKDYTVIIDPIVERKRKLAPWDLVEDTHKKGKAWDQIYKGGLGNHSIIPKELIKERG